MAEDSSSMDEELDGLIEHFVAAFDELHEAVRLKVQAGAYTSPHHDYPNINFRDNGFPYFMDRGFYGPDGPRNYVDTTRPTSIASMLMISSRDKTNFPKSQALAAFLEQSSFASKLFSWSSFSTSRIDRMLDGAVERYMQLFGTGDLLKEKRGKVLRPLLNSLLFDTYPLRMVVPVALTGFESDHFAINESTYLTRMPTALQQARARRKGVGSGASDGALYAATHAFVWTGWSIEPETIDGMAESLNSPATNVLDAVDLLFACVRAATGANTGYAQVLFCPHRWATGYYVDLPEVYGFGIRRYPSEYDATYYQSGHPIVTKTELSKVKRLYNLAAPLENDRISIALKRLNSCMTRDDATDAILDATIGLEVLLGEGSDAISYKIRMRAAALSMLRKDRDPSEVLEKVKSVYSFRSKIVHGATSKSKASKTVGNDAQERFAEQRAIATDMLRYVIDVLIEHPAYLEPEVIDARLMLGSEKFAAVANDKEPQLPGFET